MSSTLPLEQFVPHSQLVVPEHEVLRARFAAIDAHVHLHGHGERSRNPEWRIDSAARLFERLDERNVRAVVDLDGYVDSRLPRAIETYKGAYPGRAAILAAPDWSRCQQPGWPEALAAQFRHAVGLGADGLKVPKDLGLVYRDERDALLRLDDRRLDALWAAVGEAGMPVLIHVADPVAFFTPVDRHNERWDELASRPEWSWYRPGLPTFAELIDQLIAIIERHPGTTFQMAHVGCYAENLQFVAERILKPYANAYTDISERIAELGRQPYSARRFIIENQDRILFGSDRPLLGPWHPFYFRFLETWDEYFPHGPEEPPRQGRWNIHGIGLPDDVLAKVYYQNAERLYPSLRQGV
ncbi:MAG: amidohydrolase family protein [Anaerolineae bacterium]